jgi:tetratricopeptide (TPR) repeat protein
VIAALLSLLTALPQGAEPGVFQTRELQVPGGGARTVVAADKRQIHCLAALRELAKAVNWNLVIESTPLENDLRFASIDLNFAGQDPRMVAQLIAVAGGADSIFDEPAGFEGARVTLHVVRVPSGETKSGRQRLRALAGQWYRSFLQDELQFEPIVEREGVAVRMHLGELLVYSGDLESAIRFFSDVYESGPNDSMTAAILKIASCHLDLAAGSVDREQKIAHSVSAEEWARRVFERPSSRGAPAGAQATILLGRALLGKARHQEDPLQVLELARLCQDEMQDRVIYLLDSVELMKAWLIAGEAQAVMGRPDRVYQTMMTLRESAYFEDLGPTESLDYRYLLGFGALGIGKVELAMRAIEWFLIHAENDPRRGQAYVLLSESYLAQDRFLEARAASVEARKRYLMRMPPQWRERSLKAWARTALALGEKEEAFLELEQIALRGDELELTLFLVDELLRDRQWQRAISIARSLAGRDDAVGDEARFKTVRALYEQAVAGQHLKNFPAQAIPLAPKIKDEELRSQVATMIGDAYTSLEMLEHAADAYRGILR